MLSKWLAATLFKADIQKLKGSLSLRSSSEELAKATNNSPEPYREVLKKLEARLKATVDSVNSKLIDSHIRVDAEPLTKTSELMEPLLRLHRSITQMGLPEIADGALTDTIRRVATFGLSLMPMDIRQESARHTEALDAITKYLGIGSFSQWDESTRCSWLQAELSSKRPLLHRGCNLEAMRFSPTVVDTLRTFEMAASLGEGSIGAYVISHCEQASDVLAVMLLQQEAGVTPALKVVPLFETLDDLERASNIIDSLFSMAIYRGRIGNKQQIMVGYSDSAKDAGLLAACWAQYNAQVAIVEVANRHGIELTFFHGKGGTVGRGGNPALYQAILAHPPKTINGRFRITEQGEMITQNYGQEAVAERTLDLFTAGVLTERFLKRPEVKQEWKDMMDRLAEVSCRAYRYLLKEDPRFLPYFKSATPEFELTGLNVGSRPAKRNPKGGIDSLRAIPWVFAWTQTRLNLPTWLGVGEALNQELRDNPLVLQDMYKNWPWFTTLIDLLEMILAKSDTKIAENYDKQLVMDPEGIELGKELRTKMEVVTKAILAITGNPHLQAGNKMLLSSLNVRNPYLDPLNIIQAELLKRLRFNTEISEEERKILQDALLITINGIANGMRNSG